MGHSAATIDPDVERLQAAGYRVVRATLEGTAYVAGDGVVVVSTAPEAPAIAAAGLLRRR